MAVHVLYFIVLWCLESGPFTSGRHILREFALEEGTPIPTDGERALRRRTKPLLSG